MAVKDYKKLYTALNAKYKVCAANNSTLVEQYNTVSMKYRHLDTEFTKAVEANKRQQIQLHEQRGVITFLEIKLTRLMETLDAKP